jgi:hypothetical protein
VYRYRTGDGDQHATPFLTREDGVPVEVTTLNNGNLLTQVITGFQFADVYVSNNVQVLSMKAQDNDLTAVERCHENCRQGTDESAQCDSDGFQAAGCNTGLCTAGFETPRGPMICYKDPVTVVPIGGLFLDPTKIGSFSTTGQLCSNRTSLFNVENTEVAGISTALRIIGIVGVSLLGLSILIIGVIKCAGGKSPGMKGASFAANGFQYPNQRANAYQMNNSRMSNGRGGMY